MSNTTKTKVPSIPKDSEVTIKISGLMYGRILGVYFNLLSKYSQEEALEIFKVLEKDSISTLSTEEEKLNATAIETLLILTKGIELQFQNENKLVEEELDVPNED